MTKEELQKEIDVQENLMLQNLTNTQVVSYLCDKIANLKDQLGLIELQEQADMLEAVN